MKDDEEELSNRRISPRVPPPDAVTSSRTAGGSSAIDAQPVDIELKRLIVAKAWKRANELPGRIFGEPMLFVSPPLNILLDLYIARGEDQTINVSSVCIGSGAPATTALRYIARLMEMGFVHKSEDVRDHRVQYVGLTPEGLATMARTLDAVADSDRRLGIERLRFVQ